MIRKLLVITALLAVILLLVDGHVPKRYCDLFLGLEWSEAGLRQDDGGVPIRPTRDQAKHLRNVIRVCKPFTSRINLWDPLSGDFSVWGEGHYWGDISLITLAVELDDVSLLQDLVEDGHPINGLPNSLGISTLYFATARESHNVFSWLLDNGVDPNLTDAVGGSAILIAATQRQDRFPSLRELIDAGADPNLGVDNGGTPLAAAIQANLLQNAGQLVDAGADVNQATNFLTEWAENAWSEGIRNDILLSVESFRDYLETQQR